MKLSTPEVTMENEIIFDMLTADKVCLPAPAMRSCSSFSKNCSNYLTIEPDVTQRRHSMPNYDASSRLSTLSIDTSNIGVQSSIRRVRSFRTTAKGVVNGGDLLRARDTGTAVWAGCTVTVNQQSESKTASCRKLSTTSQDSGAGYSWTSSAAPSYFRVLMLGSPGVGKQTLTNQFRSSANSEAVDESSAWDETVSMLLDDEEYLVEFCSYPDDQLPEADINIDAYVIVYSIASIATYENALRLIKHLRNVVGTDRSIILVANKTDLVRNRAVGRDDVRQMASQFACKYVETSAALHHNVDELLVGIVSQIRIKLNPAKFASYVEHDPAAISKNHRRSMSVVRGFFHRVFHRQKSLSCDNLYDI